METTPDQKDSVETHSIGRATARPVSELTIGSVVGGRYEVCDLLGQGGMGRVWCCRDLLEEREVALKEVATEGDGESAQPRSGPHDLVGDNRDVMFKREFFTMTTLAHPNTVKVYDCGLLSPGHRYITMEVVRGEDLAQRVRQAPLELSLVYRVLVELSQVLAFIHSRLYVHCDIKANNVRLTETEAVKLLDFGLMHQLGTPASASLRGTPSYMAPELTQEGIIDARTDLYSLGVLAFVMLTGRLPFRAPSVDELIELHQRAAVPSVRAEREIPEELDAVVARLMAKRQRDRFADAGELLAALEPLTGIAVDVSSISQRTSYLATVDLVGREREAEILRARLADLTDGRARSLLVGAPGGIGKSRLLHELRLHAKLADMRCGVGQCRAEGQRPLQPLVDALAPIVDVAPRALLETGDKATVFANLTSRLKAAAAARPFVICLEDLHWADAATIEYMNVVVRAIAGEPAMLLGTLRSDEVDRVSLIYQTVDEGTADVIELAPLGEEATRQLLEAMLKRHELLPQFATKLYETTRGNAFFVTETLRSLIERDLLKLRGTTWHTADGPLELPPSINEAIASRLRTLEPTIVELARALSALGRVLPLEIVQPLAALSHEELFARLDVLVERQVIQKIDGRYWFTHDHMREAIYRGTPDGIRRRAHRRIAETLLAQATDDHAAIGYHFARSDEPQKAIRHLSAAGERSLAANLFVDAMQHFDQVAELLDRGGEPPAELLHAWARLIDAGWYAHPPTAERNGEKLFRAWHERFDLAAAATQLSEQRRRWRAAGTGSARELLARSYCDRPLDAASDDALAIVPHFLAYHCAVGSICGSLGQFDRSFAMAEETLAYTPEREDPFRAAALLSRSVALIQRGQWTQQQAEAHEAMQVFEEHLASVGVMPRRMEWYHAESFFFVAMGQAQMGLPLDAAVVRRGLELARRHQFDDVVFFLRITELMRGTLTGDPQEFEGTFGALVETVQRTGRPRLYESRLFLFVPFYYIYRRENSRADAAIEKLESFLGLMDDGFVRLHVLLYRTLAAVADCDWDRAEQSLPAAIALANERHFSRINLLLCAKAQVHLARRQTEAARRFASEALERARSPAIACSFEEMIALRVLGEALAGPEGVVLLRQSLALARILENPIHTGQGLLALGRMLSSADAERRAVLDEAAQVFEALRADAWLKDVDNIRRSSSGTS